MELSQIMVSLEKYLQKIKNDIDEKFENNPKAKINDGKYIQLILSKLRNVLGNPINNPIMKFIEAEDFYFGNNGLKNITNKYQDILDLQHYIVENTFLPFVFDKYTILKMLQITMLTYNEFIDDIVNKYNNRDEDIANIFIDIDTMLLNDRNLSAENGTKNAKAVDTINKYKTKNGGYGVVSEKEIANNTNNKTINILVSPEEAQRKLNAFGFSQMLENKNGK